MLNPLVDVERKRSTEVGGELVTINVNEQILDGAQQQKLHKQTTRCVPTADTGHSVMVDTVPRQQTPVTLSWWTLCGPTADTGHSVMVDTLCPDSRHRSLCHGGHSVPRQQTSVTVSRWTLCAPIADTGHSVMVDNVSHCQQGLTC